MISLFLSGTIRAQVSTSRIEGTVVDQTGAAIPGAQVTAKNEGTNVSYTATTTEAGTYAFPSLIVGSYTIAVQAAGFKKWVSTKNILTVGAPLVVDAKLEVGALTSTVQVESTYERLETTNAMISDVVDRRSISELPLNGKNPLNLITLEPGLIQRSNGTAGSGTHVNGSRDRAFNVTLDGIDINEPSVPNPQSNVFRLNTTNVQEYRVVTHNATAEFGRNSGANIALASRSGANALHGDIFEYLRNPKLNANDWFNNLQGIPRPNFRAHIFGVDVGGPIRKDRTFFFGSWQGNRLSFTEPISQAFGSIPLVYTASARAGKLRYVSGTVSGTSRNNTSLVDAQGNLLPGTNTCGGAVTTSCIATYDVVANDPATIGLDAVMSAFINAMPLPNNFSVGDGLNTAGFSWNPPSGQPEERFLGRIDHQFNENNSVFGRYLFAFADTKGGDFLNNRPQVFPGFPPRGLVNRRPKNLAVSYRRVFSPRLVNEYAMGLSRFKFDFLFGRANPNFPNIPPFDPSNIDTPFNNQSGTARFLTTIQFIDNVSYTVGAHLIRGGINFRLLRHNDQRSFIGGVNNAPRISFSGGVGGRVPGAAFGLPATCPDQPPFPPGCVNSNDIGTLQNGVNELLGLPASLTQSFFSAGLDSYTPSGLYVRGARSHQYDAYIQDEWKLRPNITLNLGLRYEWNRPATEAHGLILRPDKAVNGSQGLVNYVQKDTFWDRENGFGFLPRIGIAWDPWSNGKTVARAGYGMAYDTVSTFQLVPILGRVPGSSAACSLVNTGSGAGRITPGCPLPANTDKRVGQGFPLSLPLPSSPPSAFTGTPAQSTRTAPPAGAVDPNLQNPTVHEWDLAIQRDLGKNVVVQVAYVGKRGTHLLRAYDLNQVSINHDGYIDSFIRARNNVTLCNDPNGTSTCGQPVGLLASLFGGTVPNTGGQGNTVRSNLGFNAAGGLADFIDGNFFSQMAVATGNPGFFRPNPQFSSLFYFDSGGDSYYHALQIQMRRQERNLSFGVAYTWGKSQDNMSVDPVGAVSGGAVGNNTRTPTDIRNFRVDNGVSDFDRRHLLVSHAVWSLPFGRGQRWANNPRGILNHLVSGWETTGILSFMTGEAYSVLSGRFTNSNIRASRADIAGNQPPSGLFDVSGIVGPVTFPASVLPRTNLTGTPFSIPPPGSNGGQGRNLFHGPNYFNLDLGVSKRFDITERVKLQFRAEAFNAFNHPNFDTPLGSSDGTTSIASNNFARTCCVAVSVPSSSSVISVGEAPRVIQFALTLSF
jgi:hypothetical protein